MNNLASVAERLRVVKNAERRFLRMWDIERMLVNPLLDLVAADVGPAHPAPGHLNDLPATSHSLMDLPGRLDDEQ